MDSTNRVKAPEDGGKSPTSDFPYLRIFLRDVRIQNGHAFARSFFRFYVNNNFPLLNIIESIVTLAIICHLITYVEKEQIYIFRANMLHIFFSFKSELQNLIL